MRKNKKKLYEEVEVLDFASEGKCIAKIDGQVVFIEGNNVAPGDVVKLLVKKKKKNYSEGTVLNMISKSASRIEPFCSHFGTCGGCKWQHIPYSTQLEQKHKQVLDQLTRIGKLDINEVKPILAAPKTQFYRNKLEFTFANGRWLSAEEIKSEEELDKDALGFHIPKRFDKVLPITKCYLQEDPSNEIRNWFAVYAKKEGHSFYDHRNHKGFFRNLMIRTASTGQTMLVVQFAYAEQEEIDKVMKDCHQAFPGLTSLNYFINTKGNDSYFDLEPHNYSGTPYIEENMEGLVFRIGVKSFYQTNSEQAYNLYKITRELAKITKDDLVYDLYTGTGTIANFVAKEAKKVIGIEYIPEAIEDAKLNSVNNGIENTEFFAGDMAKILNQEFIEKNGKPNVIITDPPRAGMAKEVIESILFAMPERIVYVSCNAATQARDLALLKEHYTFECSQAVDMFPHTHHVENVVSLVKI